MAKGFHAPPTKPHVEILRNLYEGLELSPEDIAVQFKTTRYRIIKWLHSSKIPIRDRRIHEVYKCPSAAPPPSNPLNMVAVDSIRQTLDYFRSTEITTDREVIDGLNRLEPTVYFVAYPVYIVEREKGSPPTKSISLVISYLIQAMEAERLTCA